jgi:hypothetical protein
MSAQTVYDRLSATAASHVAKTSGLEDAAAPGPFLVWIEGLVAQFLPMLINGCVPPAPTPAAAVADAANPRLIQRARLKFAIWRSVPDGETYQQIGQPVFDGLLAAGKTLTEADVAEVLSG